MTINLRDYSRTAEQRGWGAGWPSCSGAKGDTVIVTAERSKARISVRRRAARLASVLIDWTEDPRGGNYLLKPAQTGGYNCRPIGGTKRASNHSWALAADVNWQENPYTTKGTRTIPTAVARKWNRYGWAWGGDYSGAKKDFMHLEFMGTPAQADAMTALAMREIAGRTAPATNPAPVSGGRPTLQKGATGPLVGSLIAWANRTFPAYPTTPIPILTPPLFGPGTDGFVREFQRRSGLTADGVVGPKTWAAMERNGFR